MHLVTSPVMVGRDDELAVLDSCLVAARDGRGGVVVVSGEAGVGKSRLTREAENRAEAAGMVVARGRAVPDAVQVPFRALAEATHAALRETTVPVTPDLEPFRAVLGPFVPDWAAAGSGSVEGEVVVLEAVVRLLRAIAAGRGLLIVLEDVHWADRDTLAAIEYAAEALTTSRVCCICTERSHMTGPTVEVTSRLTAGRAARRIQLERLGDDDVLTLARIALNAEAPPASLVGVLRRRAEGLPFLVEELLSAYLSAAGSVQAAAEWRLARRVADALPSSFHDLLRARLRTLEDAARHCVRAAAILGRTFDWRLLAPITGLTTEAVLDALRAAVSEQVLISGDADADAFSFRHALVREAVLAELLPPERAELSFAAAEAIEDNRPGLPGEWCERAAELRDQAGDVLGACRLLQESARRALARGALSSAEATLRRARDLAADDYMMWLGTDLLLSEVLARAGKTNELVELSQNVVAWLETTLKHAPRSSYALLMLRPRMAELHLQVARAAAIALDPALAGEHLAEARHLAEDDEILHLRIDLLSAALALGDGDSRTALARGQTCLEAAERTGAAELVLEALDVVGRALTQEGDLGGAVSVFRRLEVKAHAHSARVWKVRALEELGMIESLRHDDATALEAARALAIETGAVSALASINLGLGWHRLARPSIDEAEAFIDEALEAGRAFSLPILADALVARAACFALRNQPREERAAVTEALQAGRGRPEIEASGLAEADAVLALVREDRATASAALEEAVDLRARWRRGTPWWFGLRNLLRAVDDIPDGTDVAGPASANPVGYACVLYARAVREGRRGRADEALQAFAAADAAMPEGWKRQLCRRLVSEPAADAGWGDPGTWAHEALDFFDPLGLAAVANACKRVMRQAGTPVPRAGRGESTVPAPIAALGITSREMDVLTLVAEGLSNTEIGARLFLSPRTVETHVSSLTRKARIATRPQLVAFAAKVLADEAAT